MDLYVEQLLWKLLLIVIKDLEMKMIMISKLDKTQCFSISNVMIQIRSRDLFVGLNIAVCGVDWSLDQSSPAEDRLKHQSSIFVDRCHSVILQSP